ncbi:MAG: DUF4270 domain-containing protein [Prevotellaceae bacterium]|nr:DUF4270 domain-containing protein [Prevotellaceae bacterium]
MKKINQFAIILLSFVGVAFGACKDDVATDVGAAIQPPADKIVVATHVQNLTSQTQVIDSIYLNQDSLQLGAFADNTFGTAVADILTQLMCPLNFEFPKIGTGEPAFAEFDIDSAKIEITYTSWVGNGNSLMNIRAYELTGKDLINNGKYSSNIDVSEYCDLSQPIAEAVLTPNKGNLGTKNIIVMPLSQEFVRRFDPRNAAGDKVIYSNIENFLQFFKGLYITTDFGSSAMLNVSGISINYYYHYKRTGGETVNLALSFPSNREVVRVNRVEHPDRQTITIPDTVTYVSSPANFYTQINIPLRDIYEQMQRKVDGKKMQISAAVLEMQAKNSADSYLKMPSYMLAIKSDAMQPFFDKKRLPSGNDTCATYTTAQRQILATNDTTYLFQFELSRLFATEFHRYETLHTPLPETLEITVLPITLALTSTTYGTTITGTAHYLPVSGLALRNHNSSKPVKMRILYNGY